ncbi:amino acid ABC transporter substrate-binding protein [Leuconostoc gasicomitatum]|uniref:Amino acid ABC transporter substrate-binding protein n=1 Tax=Leuconostoc gasicomitatum TaxID=115778 RepID=A0A9Q3SYQ5_9LACO|nr:MULTISPECIES: amino acid ABC transporter substrate-binding protein [Leuconostoc]MBZ5946408.1 amino acid ABC transporter substrate-binding protein [Leuconostoc gasicomitatum]MBZ5948487.1 amino acid ABC transporter substrate-binding protein [Leuconostoc gasicomitatum]MBZ5957393.1 amino acid ABC transporter substrate-binding protein [Leuconostoc gasicomitatum]MBZ5958069.1 amino acid ABC transporter substrate-binding protein [Leuconostoc gasicomitatum]MBZ5963289.1 amino acid ABC transporter sub
MVSMKKKIVVNAIIGLLFFGIVVWLAVGLSAGAKHNSQANQETSKTDEWQRIKQDKQITIGLDDTFVPMGFRDKDGKIIGFDVDLANAVFKTMGITVKWQPIDWSMKETELNTGNIDAIWNGYTKTAAREKQVAFSNTYHNATQVLVTLKKNNINSFSDMKGKVLGDQTASSGDESFNQHPKVLKQYVKDQKVVGYDTFDKAFNDLNAGRIDGLLIDEDYARYYVAHQANPRNYTVTVGGFSVDETAVGFRKSDNQLRQAVNQTLSQFKKDGRMKHIENKWFSN